MIEKPLKKHGGKPSRAPVNAVIKTLLQESHFTLKEFAQFADVGATTIENYLYMRTSPVASSGKVFWKSSAKKLARAFGLNPEDIFPIEIWENELNSALRDTNHAWCIRQWRATNTDHIVYKHDMRHQLFHTLMKLPYDYRTAVICWAKGESSGWRNKLFARRAIERMRHLFFKEK